MNNVKKIVNESYSKIADGQDQPCACSGSCCQNKSVSKSIGYSDEQLEKVGGANLGLGCGNPVAFSNINQGDTVLDLGSGAGIDCFLAAEKAGTEGRVIGIDFTDGMIKKAKANAKERSLENVEFIKGDIEKMPIETDSVNIIISNCVINLAPDKEKVFSEAKRILKKEGKMFVSDIVLLKELSEEQKKDKDLIAGCVGGALLKYKYIGLVKKAGFKVNILSENTNISKEQYKGIPLESLMIEAIKT